MPATLKRAHFWDLAISLVGLIAAALIFSAFVFLSTQVNTSLEQIQRESSMARVSSVLQAFDQNTHHLADYTTGYAMWDDGYKFMESHDPAFLETNYAPSVMALSPVQLVAIYDLQGQMLFAAALDETAQPFTAPPQLKEMPRLEDFSRLRKAGDFAGSVEWIGERAYLIAVCPITNSAATAPIRGYLLFGTLIGDKMLRQVHNLTATTVTVSSATSPPAGSFHISTNDLGPAEVTLTRLKDSPDSLATAFYREDNHEQKPVTFQIRLPELISPSTYRLKQSVALAFVIISFGFALYFALSLREIRRRRFDILQRIIERDDLKAARDSAETLADKAEAADRAKSAFLAMISHEIRTPLNAIIGYADLLRNDPSEDLSGRLEIISRSGGTLQRILDDILDYSKIEAGKLDLHPRSVCIRRLVQELADTFQNQAAVRGNRIILEMQGNIPEYLVLDDLRVRQVLGNLLSNAVKFTENGIIRITVAGQNVSPGPSTPSTFPLSLVVEDEGIGIPESAKHALFEPFSQADSTAGRRYQGTGLGLAICRRLCVLMGGNITYHRRSEKGSAFAVSLPAPISSAPVDLILSDPFDARSEQNDLVILVVDDNAVNARLFQAILQRLGRQAQLALSGEKAIELFHRIHPDIIFLDIHMPGLDGLETARRIRQSEAETGSTPCTIIAVTADTSMANSAQSVEAGFNGQINKPVSIPQIAEKLSSASSRKHQS